jgi:hypothetical protein
VLGDLAPIVVAIVTSIGTIGAAAFGARRIAGRNPEGARAASRWREQAELAAARADVLSDELDDERRARLEAERRLGITQHDLDDCARQRDDAFSELRSQRRLPGRPRA